MSWARLDDMMHSNAKHRKAGLEAVGLWAHGLSYTASNLENGFVPFGPALGWCGSEERLHKLAAKLVTVGLWDVAAGGWQIHDYLKYNPSSTEVKTKRQQGNERVKRHRTKLKSVT